MALFLFEKADSGVGVLTPNRSEKLNALSIAPLGELSAVLDAAEADPEVRIVILTGAGERAFAAGADIAEYRGRREKAFMDFQFGRRRLNDRLEAFLKPAIAAANGYARRRVRERSLLRRDRRFDQRAPWPVRGAARPLSMRWRNAAPHPLAWPAPADLLLTARRRLKGERAFRFGLAAALREPEALMETALSKARAILKVAPLALGEMKRLVRIGADAGLPTALALEQKVLFRLYCSADGQEGIGAFLEKRGPEFKGA
jgi:enoyl-CoA hydratase